MNEDHGVPDAVGSIRGYRLWAVRKEADGRYHFLRSSSPLQHPWPTDRPIVASCLRRELYEYDGRAFRRRHDGEATPPVRGCSCGIYMAKSWQRFVRDYWLWPHYIDEDYKLRSMPWAEGAECVIGEVEGWGRVVRHDLGWRVQYARPACFLQPPNSKNEDTNHMLFQLSQHYDVPVVLKKAFPLVLFC